ncbi:3110_t:CDS:2 [Gigaspora margarita]|uniref:DNA 3'-5' helicase n=1 Tax=Gigaspora margarita TaxID=4874 RepID=A0ABN7URR1_GIGMA|nr:3110_t:CDS:2 [Gigaspora margarita]
MPLTATLSWNNIEALQDNLRIDQSYFAVMRGNDLLYQELYMEETSCAIIYCARIMDCSKVIEVLNTRVKNLEMMEILNIKLEEESLDMYNGQLSENEKKAMMKKWNSGQMHVIIAISAFGLRIDTPDVRLVIYYNFPSNMSKLKSGWAGRNQESAQCVILYSGKDIRTNYAIISDKRRYREDKVKQEDVLMDILDMVNVINMLYENNDKPIILVDIVDVFCCSNNVRLHNKKLTLLDLDKHSKPSFLRTKPLAKLALADLVCHKLVKQTILFEKKTNSAHFTCSVVIEGVVEDMVVLATAKTWL